MTPLDNLRRLLAAATATPWHRSYEAVARLVVAVANAAAREVKP